MSTAGDAAYEAFAAQAQKCERFAAGNPSAYRLRVTALAVLGYLFPPAVIIVLMTGAATCLWAYTTMGPGVGAGFLVANVGGSLIAFMVLVIRAMMPGFSRPEGVRLRRAAAPRLFNLAEKVRRKTRGPRIHRLYLTHEMNAAVSQGLRLGFLGGYRNELYLGLPLLQALTPLQLAAVIAHEFGHLSAAHGKHRAWIYRTRTLMIRVLNAIEEKRRLGSSILLWFYRWYAPHFAAYSFALARMQEYEADRLGAKAASGQTLVDALVRISVGADYVSDIFQNEILTEAGRRPRPPADVYQRVDEKLKRLAGWVHAPRSIKISLSRTTDYGDTHPSLGDRAAALGATPRLPADTAETAIGLLPDNGAGLTKILSRRWQDLAQPVWTELHKEANAQKARLAELDAEAKRGRLAEGDAIERAELAERHLGTEAALARIDQAVVWHIDSDEVLFVRARLLLKSGRGEEGLSCLDRLIERNEDAVIPACELAEDYLESGGREEEAEAYRDRRRQQEALFEADWQTLDQVHVDDELLAHTFSPGAVRDMAQIINRFRYLGLRAAWLVRKAAGRRETGGPHLLVCELSTVHRWSEDVEELGDRISAALAELGDVAVIVCEPDVQWLRDKAAAVKGAQIFPEAGPGAAADTAGGGPMQDSELLSLRSMLGLPDDVVLFLRDQPVLNPVIKGIRTFAVVAAMLMFLIAPLLFPQLHTFLIGVYFRAGVLPQDTLLVKMPGVPWASLFACLAAFPLGAYFYRLWMRVNGKRYLQSIASLLHEIVAPNQKARTILTWLTRRHLPPVESNLPPRDYLTAYERRSATPYCAAVLVLYFLAVVTFAYEMATTTRVTRNGTVLQVSGQGISKSYTWHQAVGVHSGCMSDPESAGWIRALYLVRFEDGQSVNLTRYFAPGMSSIGAVLSVDRTLGEMGVPLELGVMDPKCPGHDRHFLNLVKRQRGLQGP